jgi:glycosyl hydrolase family 2
VSPIRLATLAAVLALLAFVLGARLRAEASGAGAPAAVPAARAPMTLGGPDGRVALDGAWTVRADRAGQGVARGWPRGRFAGRTVRVPYSPNARHVTGERGARSYAGAVAWLRTTFTVARGGDHALRFESVHHRARVWVDGREVGRHTGAYLPFEARVRLTPGRHVLVVRADWRSPDAMKAAAWHRSWFNFGGINREVTVRRLGDAELDAPGVVTRVDRRGAALVTVTARVRNRAATPRTVVVRGRLGGATAAARDRRTATAPGLRRGRLAATALRFPAVRLARGRAAWVRARVRLVRPPLWSPAHPRLVTLRLAVPGEAGLTQRVGLREVRWAGGRLRLNGRRLILRGASIHEDARGRGDALRARELDAIVARLRAIGANATRAQHPLAPALLERLDRAGILVWQGVGPVDAPGAWTSTTPARRSRAVRRVRLSVLQLRAHPSVLNWNLANEVAGNGHAGGQAAYVAAAARLARRLDPGRPVALDVWGTHLPDRPGELWRRVDAVGATNYEGWYARPGATAGRTRARVARFLAGLHARFPSKVVAVTEFGAEAGPRNPAAAPGGTAYQARLLRAHIAAYRADPRLDGMLVWNLQDFALAPTFAGGSVRRLLPGLALQRGLNQKGLFTYAGRPKPAADAVKRALGR